MFSFYHKIEGEKRKMKTIEELRVDNNMTQVDLAKALGTTKEEVKKWEQKQPDLSGETIITLAKYFEITTDSLLGTEFSKDTKHNYLTAEKSEDLGNELTEIMTDLEILRGYSDGFDNPHNLTKDEIYTSYIRAFKFLQSFFYKSQRLEEQLDDIAILLLEAGDYKTLSEHLSVKEMNLPEIKA